MAALGAQMSTSPPDVEARLTDETLARLLDRVQKPGRYIGGELHRIVKDPSTTAMRICLAFPDAYEIGMSHLGLRILYSHLNKFPKIAVERAYCPFPDMEAALREDQVPLFSLETRTPLRQFHVLGFSLQSEMTNSNVLTILDLSRIPLHRQDRTEEDPLVIAGGPVIFNPEPMSDFIDAFLVGDGEHAIREFLELDLEMRDQGIPRAERLARLANGVEGTYVPALYETRTDPSTGFLHVVPTEGAPYPVRKALLDDVNEVPFPDEILVPQTEIVHDRVSVEIARGCTEGCRFCQAGIIYRPVRERTPKSIVDTLVSSVEKTGFDEASLTALSTADYSCVTPLAKAVMSELQTRRTALSVSSLRVYGVTEDLAREIARVRKTGFTIAPEAGSQRMRDVINKGITDENIDTASEIAFSNGWTRLKLYFMIGLPTETDEDVLGIAETAIRVLKIGQQLGPPGVKVVVSVSSLIPKAHSTFQWVPFDSIDELYRKQNLIRDRLRPFRGIQLKCHEVRQSRLEAVFSRGDRQLGRVIETAWRKGARFDEWTDYFRETTWLEALAECGIDPEPYFRALPTEVPLVWDHIDSRVDKEFLLKDLKWGLKSRFMHPCEKPYLPKLHNPPKTKEGITKLVCYDCGVDCDLKEISLERDAAASSAARIADEKQQKLEALDPEAIRQLPQRAVGGQFPEGGESPGRRELKAATPEPFAPTPGPLYRYRVEYSKGGLSRFLSHLETTRLLERAGTRAKWPIAFSGGYHPHPKLSFGPALPVGIGGEAEYFDVELTKPWDPDNLVLVLNETLHEGFKIRAAQRIDASLPAIDRTVEAYDYTIRFDPEELSRVSPDRPLAALFRDRVADDRGWVIESERRTKKKIKKRTLDIAPMIGWWHVEECGDGENGRPSTLLHLRLVEVDGRTTRPRDLVSSLLGEIPPGTNFLRTRVGRATPEGFETPLTLASSELP